MQNAELVLQSAFSTYGIFMIVRKKITITGIVQGVGFRPFVDNLAKKHCLCGYVLNLGSSLVIDVEGELENYNNFLLVLKADYPKNANIVNIDILDEDLINYTCFQILDSIDEPSNVYISPDIAMCQDCLFEFNNPHDYRYKYPFINCTNCGPRFSIIKNVPYDRANTTMQEFAMCQVCGEEYNLPTNRRYHAQPVCCSKCGPSLFFKDSSGKDFLNPVEKAVEFLESNKIVAIKGIGGYHIACNPYDNQVVLNLREKKNRYKKPFAIMAKNIAVAEKFVEISHVEKDILKSNSAPILLLNKKESDLSKYVAPDNHKIGIMLPYAPLHYLLFDSLKIDALVMTSANISDEPICYKDEDAFSHLSNIVDGVLYHNREINTRIDDSVVTVFKDKEYILRRSRGYVPTPIHFDKVTSEKQILALGSYLKNTFCLYKNNNYYLSHHIGDLETLETFNSFESSIDLYKKMFLIEPDIIACDMHPDYYNSKWAKNQNLPITFVQHHKAHIASCMVENNINSEVIGVAFDGTGYGEDGNIWGGEFFVGGFGGFNRVGHIKNIPIAGNTGASSINNDYNISPFKCLVPYLKLIKSSLAFDVESLFASGEYSIISSMLDRGINTFVTSSCGRLFDAAASLICDINKVSYEGEAPIYLEYIADKSVKEKYNYIIENNIVDPLLIMSEILMDKVNKVSPGVMSAKFHNTVVDFTVEMCVKLRNETQIHKVVLSGGVFQNMLLLNRVYDKLAKAGFLVYTHSKVPTNDGGISLGQAILALQ